MRLHTRRQSHPRGSSACASDVAAWHLWRGADRPHEDWQPAALSAQHSRSTPCAADRNNASDVDVLEPDSVTCHSSTQADLTPTRNFPRDWHSHY